MNIEPIAKIHTDFKDKFGIPRQSGRVPQLRGTIVFEPEYRSEYALRGIEGFSHLWVIFDFSQSHREGFSPTVRPPRLGGNERIGVFASRSPFRPNSLGLSVVRLEEVRKTETNGITLIVSGVDMLDGTPVYDIKPYIPYCDSIPDALGSFAEEEKGHSLTVDFPQKLLNMLPVPLREAAVACIADDPRPSYIEARRDYAMSIGGFDIKFTAADGRAVVYEVKKI